MGIKNLALLLLVSTVVSEQPRGVSDTLYDCEYDDTKATYIDIKLPNGEYSKCGDKNLRGSVLGDPQPEVMINGADADTYYTLVLSNPDDKISAFAPVLHNIITNIKGSDLPATDGTTYSLTDATAPSASTVEVAYAPPGAMIPMMQLTYCYVLYKQVDGVTTFTISTDYPDMAYP